MPKKKTAKKKASSTAGFFTRGVPKEKKHEMPKGLATFRRSRAAEARAEKKKPGPQTRLDEFVKVARAAGAKVSFAMEDIHMPKHLPRDHPHVTLLLRESERMTAQGNRWMNAPNPNTVAAEAFFRNGWAHSLAAAWLRVMINGELARAQDQPPALDAWERLKKRAAEGQPIQHRWRAAPKGPWSEWETIDATHERHAWFTDGLHEYRLDPKSIKR